MLKKMSQEDGSWTYAPGAFPPQYAAPEVKGTQIANKKSDLYSYAVLLAVIYNQSEPDMYDRNKPKCDAAPLWFRELLQSVLRDEPRQRPSAEDVQRTLQAHPPQAHSHAHTRTCMHARTHTHPLQINPGAPLAGAAHRVAGRVRRPKRRCCRVRRRSLLSAARPWMQFGI